MVLTSTSYKAHFKLYGEIHDLISVKSCQIEFARQDIILLSDTAVIHYGAGLHTDVEDRHLKFNLSAGTYSIDDFNAKMKVVSQPKQNWSEPQIIDLQLVIPEHDIFQASNSFFIAFGILDN